MNFTPLVSGIIFKSFLKSLLKAGIFVLACVMVFSFASAQEIPDSQGKDFWLTFLPNFHNGKRSQDPRRQLDDSLYIFVAASEVTNGKITYRSRSGQELTENFTITDPGEIYTFKVAYLNFELLGFNDSGEPEMNPDNLRIVKYSFHVETDKDVTVYALNQAVTTSDAFLVLPTDALATEYRVMSYNSDRISENSFNNTPSQFAIVATEDSTAITINPFADVYGQRSAEIEKLLQKGEVYLVQADNVNSNPAGDLTGTEIEATRPIAVFSGHQRAAVPYNFNFPGAKSRDHLVEQLPPLDTWGRSAFLIPYPTPQDVAKHGDNGAPDLFRILAGYDRTLIKINGTEVATLNRGEIYQGVLSQAAVVTGSLPILVAQFKKTSETTQGGSSQNLGDPFMMMIPPSEQFLNSYRFMNAQAFTYDEEKKHNVITYEEQYISVVAENISLPSVKLDNVTVPASRFTSIPGSKFSYATLAVSDGVHTIRADSTIGLYVFGYGAANSYGYIGGMSFRPIDFQPPQFLSEAECFKTRGLVYDSLISTSSYLDSIEFPEKEKINVDIDLDIFSADSAYFLAKLKDMYNDGRFVIKATDGAELVSRDTIEIPGFTVTSQFITEGGVAPLDDEFPENQERCFTVKLYNYGKFTQNISEVTLANGNTGFSLKTPAPLVIEPGETVDVTVCFKGQEGRYSDTLSITGACAGRITGIFNAEVIKDKSGPNIAKTTSSCGDRQSLAITEALKHDLGIASIEILDSVNITFITELKLPVQANFAIMLTDPYRDGFYAIRIIDSAGNISEHHDTIQGFTIVFPEIATSGPAIVYENNLIGFFSCDSLKIRNNGTLPFVFKNAYMLENVSFSVPQSQFPFTLMPGESRQLTVCYRPLESENGALFRDTIIFSHNCLLKKIPLEGESLAMTYSGDARCDVRLRLTTEKVPAAFLLKQNAPNPVQESTSISFGLKDPSAVKITLYDARGMAVATLLDEQRATGIYELQFVPKDIPNGMYMYELRSGKTRICRTMLITR